MAGLLNTKSRIPVVVYYSMMVLVVRISGAALPEVTLNSTLIRGELALPGQRVVFTCVTRNTTILEWQSNDYIGEGGHDFQIFSAGDSNVTSPSNHRGTYATRVSVSVENGVTVIESQLFITASEQFPTSSVTCRIGGQDPRKSLSFITTDEEPPSPKLNSTLQGVSACPGDRHQFVCIALYSHNIEWTSDEYIGGSMVVTSSSPLGIPLKASGNYTDTYAVLDNEEQVNGGLQLTSSLYIVISPSIMDQNHTITCLNSDLGTQQSMTFRMAETCSAMNLSTTYAGTVDTTANVKEASTHSVTNLIIGIIVAIAVVIAFSTSIILYVIIRILKRKKIVFAGH